MQIRDCKQKSTMRLNNPIFYCYGIFYHTSMVYLAINYHPADEVTIFLNFELFEIRESRDHVKDRSLASRRKDRRSKEGKEEKKETCVI